MRTEKRSFDFLEKLNKEQLIIYIRKNGVNPPSEYYIDYLKWDLETNQLLRQMDEQVLISNILVEKSDKITKELDDEQDLKKIAAILNKRQVARIEFLKCQRRFDSLRAKLEKLKLQKPERGTYE
jgi:hypothetical protein